MLTYSSRDARAHFADVLNAAIRGEDVTVTVHGRPAVRIIRAAPDPLGIPDREFKRLLGLVADPTVEADTALADGDIDELDGLYSSSPNAE